MVRFLFAYVRPILGGAVTALLCAVCNASAASATEVFACDTQRQLGLVAAPENLNLRYYANGKILIAAVDDQRDDVGKALSLLVVSPPLNQQGEAQCRRIAFSADAGYAALLIDKAEATYDPSKGLTVTFPGLLIPDENSLGEKIDLSVTINQATGDITPFQRTIPK